MYDFFESGARGTRTPDLLGAIHSQRGASGSEGHENARGYGVRCERRAERVGSVAAPMYPPGTRLAYSAVCLVARLRRWRQATAPHVGPLRGPW